MEKLTGSNNEIYISDGLFEFKPLNWILFPVLSAENEKQVAMLARLDVEDPKFGVMPYELYCEAIEGGPLERKCIDWQIERCKEMHSEYLKVEKEMPDLILALSDAVFDEDYLKKLTLDLHEMPLDLKDKLCFAFNQTILFKDRAVVKDMIAMLKENSIKIALNNFGDEYIAPLKLKDLDFEYIIFTSEYSKKVSEGEKVETLLAEMVVKLGYKCIMQNRVNERIEPIKDNAFNEEYYEVGVNSVSYEDLIEQIALGDLLRDVPEEVMEKYQLYDKTDDELMDIIGGIHLPDDEEKKPEEPDEEDTRYDWSFEARLSQADDEIKGFYQFLRGELLSYKGVGGKISWKHESFHKSRTTTARLLFRGKTLCLQLDLESADIKNPKYKLEFLESNTAKNTPCMVRINGPRKASYAKELISIMMKKLSAERIDIDLRQKEIPFESTIRLKYIGLIREKKVKKSVTTL